MTKKTIYIIGIFIAALTSIYAFKINADATKAASFTLSLFQLISNIGIIIFLAAIVYLQIIKKEASNPNPLKVLLISMLAVFLFVTLTNIIVNPRGIYGPSIFPTLVTNLRNKKVNDFNNLNKSPDIVIIGSSRALSLNPDYIEEKTGLTAYNFSVTGTNLDEYHVILHYVMDQTQADPPKVILIDRPGFSFNAARTAGRAPFQFFPYIDKNYQTKILTNRLAETPSFYQFTESLYVLQFFMFNQDFQPAWTVSDKGFGILQLEKSLSEELADNLSDRVGRPPCTSYYPEESIPALEEMVATAEQNNTQIIFYNSPSNPEYVTKLQAQQEDVPLPADGITNCGQIISDFYDDLIGSNPHVSSIRFSNPEDFGGYVDERGFHDGFHMTEVNNNLLIDAISDELLHAYQESILQREIQTNP